MCQLMTENMQWSCSQKRTVCVYWEHMCICFGVPGPVPSQIVAPRTTLSHRIWQESVTTEVLLLWIWQSVHLCTGYFLYSWEAKLHQYYVYPNKLNTHAFIWDRCWRCLVVLQVPDFVNHKLDGWRQDKQIRGLLLRVRDEACLCQRTCPSSPGNWSAFVLELSSVQK